MKPRLGFLEALGYGLAMAVTLTIALAHSPLWRHLGDIGFLLPARYVALLSTLPVSTNTALAFVLLLGAVGACLILMQHPVVGLAGITASVFLVSAYPFTHIRWHHLLFGLVGLEVRLPFEAPGVDDWVVHLLPLVVLMVGPLSVQLRTLVAAYAAKGVPEHDLTGLKRHLVRVIAVDLVLAMAAAIGMGILLFALLPDLATKTHVFSKNSVLVLLAVAFLLVAAIGIGTGLFRRRGPDEPSPLDDARQAGWGIVPAQQPLAYDAPGNAQPNTPTNANTVPPAPGWQVVRPPDTRPPR